MQKWLLMQVNEGRNQQGDQVVSSSVLSETHRGQTALPNPSQATVKPNTPVTWSEDKYGLGWYSGYYRGISTIAKSNDNNYYK